MASLLCFMILAAVGTSAAGQLLAPSEDILLPASESATNPLESLGNNGPWHSGPNVFGLSSDIPENCHVDQAAYVARHGSRYTDAEVYDIWLEMQERFSVSNYTASGGLSFIPTWQPDLTNPSLQMSMLNPMGTKEAQDFGYQLRTRYPDLYLDGDNFMVWAHNYTRVIQTAQAFVQGYLGFTAATNGSVVSVTSTGYPGAIGNSLNPSDNCPLFSDNKGGTEKTAWDAIWIAEVQERLQALIQGNLTLTESDIGQIPYLCGYESSALGRLSPWCNVFTDYELQQYVYSYDLRFYYGVGPGSKVAQTMMTPFLNALVGLFNQGPDITGTAADGSGFQVPNLLVSFLNDGQMVELVTASGIFDDEAAPLGSEMDPDRHFVTSRINTMRGTIGFERITCLGSPDSGSDEASAASATISSAHSSVHSREPANATYVRILLNDVVYPVPSCKNGPGSSCLLSDYDEYIQDKLATQGDFISNCNITTAGAPTTVQGASFFTDLSSPWLQSVRPY